MKTLLVLSLLLISYPVLAVSEKARDNSANFQKKVTEAGFEVPKGSEIRTSVKQATQNQGDITRIKVREREEVNTKEYLETMTPAQTKEKAENARENMSDVARQVHELLADPNRFGGIGEQVREIAQNQQESQRRLENHYEKLQRRAGIIKTLFGPDQESLDGIAELVSENEARLEELIDLRDSSETDEEFAELDEMINTIMDQNAGLIQTTETQKNIGFFKGFFSKLGALFPSN